MARSIAATNDYVEQGTVAVPTTGSLSIWAYATWLETDGIQHWLFGCQDATPTKDFSFQKFTDNKLYCGWNTPGGTDSRVVVASAGYTLVSGWNHFLLTWTNAGTSTLYLNGSSIGTQAGTVTFNTGGITRTLGRASIAFVAASSAVGWNGRIAEYALWNKVLTANEAKSLNTGKPAAFVQTAALIDYLPLYGVASPENNFVNGGTSGTVTGTSAANNSPVQIFSLAPSLPSDGSAIFASRHMGSRLLTGSTDGTDVLNYIKQGSAKLGLSTTGGSVAFWMRQAWAQNDGVIHGIYTIYQPTNPFNHFFIQTTGASGDSGTTAPANMLEVFWDQVQFSAAWTTTTTTLLQNAWNHICSTWTVANGTDATPLLYVNGVKQTGSAPGVSSWWDTTGFNRVLGAYQSGAGPTIRNSAQARFAHYGVWNVALNQNEITALAKGKPPLYVRKSALTDYLPIYGLGAPEPNFVSGGAAGTVNGSCPPLDGPPVQVVGADWWPTKDSAGAPVYGWDVVAPERFSWDRTVPVPY